MLENPEAPLLAGEQPLNDVETRPGAELVEIQQKLDTMEKRYNDLRPHADRAQTQLNDTQKQLQDLQMRNAILEREREVNAQSKVDPLSEDQWYSEEDTRVFNDFPEVIAATDKRSELMLKKTLRAERERIRDEIRNEMRGEIEGVASKFDEMRRQQTYDSALGSGVWPAIENNDAFIQWVNEDPVRTAAMTNGSEQARISIMQGYLQAGNPAQSISQGQQQEERRQQVQSVMGTSSPSHRSGGQDLSGQQLWDAMANNDARQNQNF